MVDALRAWLIRLLKALLASLEGPVAPAPAGPPSSPPLTAAPSPSPTARAAVSLPLDPLTSAARGWVDRLQESPLPSATKRQVAVSAILTAYPTMSRSDIHLAIEQAVHDAKVARAARKEEDRG